MDSSKEVAASEKEKKPAGEESEEPSSELPSTSSGMLTMSEKQCGDLETVISRLEGILKVLKKILDVPTLLLTSLEELTEDQLKTFQSNLTSGWMLGFPPIPKSQLRNTDIQVTVDQMVERYGPEGAVGITLMILRWMNRHDVAEKLERDHTRVLLMTSLQELTEDQLKTFLFNLTSGRMLVFPPIPKRQLRNTDIQVTVDQMVERYGPEGAVEITLMILRWMNRHDVAEKLERDNRHRRAATRWGDSHSDTWRRRKEHEARLVAMSEKLKRDYRHRRAISTTAATRWGDSHSDTGRRRKEHEARLVAMSERSNVIADKSHIDHSHMLSEVCMLQLIRSFMLDVPTLLLTSLEELTEDQLKTFQSKLTSGRMLGFPPIPKRQLRNTDIQITVDQMVERYGPEGAVEITLMILRWINQHDLPKKLQSDHTETSGPEEAVETPEILKKMNWDDLSENLERELVPVDFEPVIYDQEDNGTYRFQCPRAGLFRCSITGLVFRMEGEGKVFYWTVPWDMRLLAQNGKRPAGPLFKFSCLNGSVCQLHLPHCEICPGGGCDFLSVGHVTNDHPIEFIPPREITETHIIINISGFCAYGVTKDKDAPVFPIKALVLLFYQPSDYPELESVLHVLLLPRNAVLMKVQEERARRNGARETFIETTSDCELTPDQTYSLSTDGYHQVIPKTKKFDNDKDYENYTTTFAVFLPAKVKTAELTLKKKNIAWSILGSSLFGNHEHPWKGFYRYQAPLPAATPAKPPTFPGRDFITKHRMALETRLGLLQPILLHLEDHKVLNAEEREEVVSKSTKTLQKQALLDMVVRKGDEAQEKFYQVLREADPFLVRDLEKKKA
ncbi:NACHT, LRR and PYD domains-containing protein 1b allele 1-like isoform X3 [Salmo trutta]|uniref:NACHT, LRR and PYD domains-containing protein 1b allele 1-like isoform X3 n=1 Tax=Salmo trutta TaxID=8032 RepID=UPI0011329333|nr:NACHT, LRR and PYD domains-containing protein 1b allele 1-like isoform X3 [Salmo trutta]